MTQITLSNLNELFHRYGYGEPFKLHMPMDTSTLNKAVGEDIFYPGMESTIEKVEEVLREKSINS